MSRYKESKTSQDIHKVNILSKVLNVWRTNTLNKKQSNIKFETDLYKMKCEVWTIQ